MARQVGGDEVNVLTLLPPGANPHTFEPSPKMIKELEGVRLMLVVGHGLDEWIETLGQNLPGIRIQTVDEGIALLGSGAGDPHYWLSIENAKTIASNIAGALSELDPAGREKYLENLKLYSARLDEADREIKRTLSGLVNRKLVLCHAGWNYFAEAYGLEIAGTVETPEGGEPTPKHLARLGDAIQAHGAKALFCEPAAAKHIAESVAGDFNLRVYELDPIGGADGRTSYIDLMKHNARVIAEGLRHE
jgi:zinc transport system substrate-binding protein